MSQCTDPGIGKLLFAYEFNALTEDKIESIEMHLMECQHCFDELISFQKEATLLGSDSDLRDIVRESLREERAFNGSLIRRLWKYLWPKSPIILRPAVGYALILLLIFPAYRGLRMPEDAGIQPVQTLLLIPDRSPTEDVLRAGSESYGLVSFVFRGAVPGETYRLAIMTADGEVMFEDDAFDSFDEYETGRVLLRLADIPPGAYRLVVIDPRAEHPSDTWEYNFRIEN